MNQEGLAASRYEKLQKDRWHVLHRAREAASLTIPHLMPREGHKQSSDLPTPFQSIGARGIRHLSSKLLLTLFPPHTPFYKYSIDDFTIAEIEAEAGDIGRGQIEQMLSKRERVVMQEVESSYFRTAAFEVFRQLLCAGNVVIFVPEKGSVMVFKLDQFVVNRDPSGTILELCICQSFAPSSLPEEAQNLIDKDKSDEETIKLYTYVRRTKKGKYEVFQEISGKEIPGTRKVYTEELLPYRALRLTRIDGEDYGRGYIEEYIGDLISLEGLSQTVLEGSAVISKVVTMVDPAGTTKAQDVANAENGSVIAGRPDEVTMLQAEKRGDLSVAQQQIGELQQRLSFAFLMNTAIQRQGERVTAEEIRYMAQELEDGLGGMYSLLAQEFQLPMVALFERRMELDKNVPPLPEGTTSPSIITGIDALGRGQDLRNLDGFLIGLGEQFGPEVIGRYVVLSEAIKRRGAALGIDLENLIKTEEEVAQAEQQAQMMAMAQNMGPQALQAMAQIEGKNIDADSKAEVEAMKQSKGD